MTAVDARTPCLIGWATVCRFEGEPLDGWAEALRATGVAPSALDGLDVVYCQSWPYDDPTGRLAERVGAAPRASSYTGIGGTVPLERLQEAGRRIGAGELEVQAVVGGEALDAVRRAKRAGERPAWSHRHPEKQPFPFEAPFHPAELAHQVFQAYTTFALWDVARRARLGLGVAEHRDAIGELFAAMTEVAAANPTAWFPERRSAQELTEVSPENRMVAFPYTKRLVAVMDVDIASAVVVASHGAADRLGVPADRRVYLRGGGAALDPTYVAEHNEPWRSPGMASAFAAALAAAGVGIDDIGHLDLYSCFPSSVFNAMDALGLTAGDRRAPFTVTGGLPYAGGAGSCYGLSALAAMAEVLVADPGSLGLVTGVGMHRTKHRAQVLSSGPPAGLPPAIAAPSAPAVTRPIVERHAGPAVIAAYTVHHGRDGTATDGLLVCDVAGADGARCYATVRDPDLLAALEADEWVGREVQLADAGDGVNLATA